MRKKPRLATVGVTLLGLGICILPSTAVAGPAAARLEGTVIDLDGRPAAGSTVYLITEAGQTQAQARAADDGAYAFDAVPAGQYGMGVQTETGEVAPVSGPPIRLAEGQRAHRDLKLMQADPAAVERTLRANYGFVDWFENLSAGAKAGVILAFVAAGYGVYELIDDDDEPASPVQQQ